MPTYISTPSFNLGQQDLRADNTTYIRLDSRIVTVQEILEELEQASSATGAKIYYDTVENWNKKTSLISEKSSLYIYSNYYIKDQTILPAIKIGDGLAYVVDLPFLDKFFYEHIEDQFIHLNSQDREKLNNSVCVELSITDPENLKLYK